VQGLRVADVYRASTSAASDSYESPWRTQKCKMLVMVLWSLRGTNRTQETLHYIPKVDTTQRRLLFEDAVAVTLPWGSQLDLRVYIGGWCGEVAQDFYFVLENHFS
jgi:hypothetical protein